MGLTAHHRVLIVGGGTGGLSVAARLARSVGDVAVVEPSEVHYYQPLWTLVGAGIVEAEKTRRFEASVMPGKVAWIRDAAAAVDPENRTVTTESGDTYGYDVLVLAPGIQLDWHRIPGVTETLGRNGVSSNYRYDLAPRTWDFIRSTTSGTAVFTMPSGPIKCAGAPQKIAYLAADHWRRAGVLDDIDVHLVLPTPRIFGLAEFADALDAVIDDYGITLHTQAELHSVDADSHKAVFASTAEAGGGFTLPYDVLHVVPHQSAPDWIKASPLSTGDANGYIEVDKHTLQHVRHPEVFALGDAASTPNAKTGAAIRKQAPVVVANVLDQLRGGTRRPATAATAPVRS
jgi:sulfide:quinone oxidoreductase